MTKTTTIRELKLRLVDARKRLTKIQGTMAGPGNWGIAAKGQLADAKFRVGMAERRVREGLLDAEVLECYAGLYAPHCTVHSMAIAAERDYGFDGHVTFTRLQELARFFISSPRAAEALNDGLTSYMVKGI